MITKSVAHHGSTMIAIGTTIATIVQAKKTVTTSNDFE